MDCVKIDTLVSGEIDCVDFKKKLLQNKDKPAIVNVNIGLDTILFILNYVANAFDFNSKVTYCFF